MKRARPKNKKAAMRRERELEKKQYGTEETVQNSENEKSYADIIDEIRSERDDGETTEKPRYSEPTVKETANAEPVKKVKKKKKHRPLKIILTTVIAFVVLAFFGMGVFDFTETLTPIENGKINVLMLGVDEEGLRTDAIMVASYDIDEAQVNMLSVPRDTKVHVTNRNVTRKINEVHAMSSKTTKGEILGAEATAEAVSQLTGIPINYYVEFSFSAIDNLFEILGPVEFDVPDVEGKGRGMNYDDPVQNLHIHLKPGLQELSGNQVQQFVRYRKSNSGAGSGSDTDRVARQQEFVKAVIDQKLNAGIILKLPDIYSQLSKDIKTNISAADIMRYARYLNKLTGESIHTHSLPGENKTISGGSYYVCDLAQTKTLIAEVFGYDAEITDDISVSDSHSQEILKGGNMTKNKEMEQKSTASDKKDAVKATASPAAKATPTPEPTKAPAVTKEPVKAPAVTKEPLEEIYDE